MTQTRNHLTPHIRVTVENTGGNSITRLFDIIWSCLILSTDYVLCCTAPSYTLVIVDSVLNEIKLKIGSVTISHWMVCYLVCGVNGGYALSLLTSLNENSRQSLLQVIAVGPEHAMHNDSVDECMILFLVVVCP